MSFYSGTQSEILFANGAAYPAANASSAAAQSLIAGASGKFTQPLFPGGFFQFGRNGQVVSVDFAAALTGQASATTALFTLGLSTTSNNIAGSTLVSTGTFTVTNFASATIMGRAVISCFGAGYGTSSVSTNLVSSLNVAYQTGNTAGASALGGPTSLTTIDASLNQWLYLTVTFSTSSATNSVTLSQLLVSGLN